MDSAESKLPNELYASDNAPTGVRVCLPTKPASGEVSLIHNGMHDSQGPSVYPLTSGELGHLSPKPVVDRPQDSCVPDAVASEASQLNPKTGLNSNVRLVFVYVVLLSMYSSLISQTPLSVYITLITDNSKTDVGIATGIQGVISLLVALPIGALSDRIGRQIMLRIAAIVALVAAAYTAVCLLYFHGRLNDIQLYIALCGSSVLWGLFMGLHSAPLEALFADSVPSGNRSKIYVRRSSLRTLGNAMGPLASVVVFAVYGDTWKLNELTVVLMVGVVAAIPPSICLFFFRDSAALGGESEGLLRSETRRLGRQLTAVQIAATQSERKVCCFTVQHVAPLVGAADVLSMLGSGMTVKFFALFFKEDLHFRPIITSIITLCAPIGIATTAIFMQRVSLYIGRVQTTIACRLASVSMLATMAFVETPYAIVPLYLVRTWLSNCTSGLTKSIMNDYVPKRDRGKWNALESINLFSWSGSAFLGGVITDQLGYQGTFLVTASLQLMAILCICPLLFLVQAETSSRAFRKKAAALTPIEPTAVSPDYLLPADAPESSATDPPEPEIMTLS